MGTNFSRRSWTGIRNFHLAAGAAGRRNPESDPDRSCACSPRANRYEPQLRQRNNCYLLYISCAEKYLLVICMASVGGLQASIERLRQSMGEKARHTKETSAVYTDDNID